MPDFPFLLFPLLISYLIIIITYDLFLILRWPRGGKFLIYPAWSTHLRILCRYRGPWVPGSALQWHTLLLFEKDFYRRNSLGWHMFATKSHGYIHPEPHNPISAAIHSQQVKEHSGGSGTNRGVTWTPVCDSGAESFWEFGDTPAYWSLPLSSLSLPPTPSRMPLANSLGSTPDFILSQSNDRG